MLCLVTLIIFSCPVQLQSQTRAQSNIAWGTPNDGLQAGLTCTGQRRVFHLGDKIEFQIRLRNVSNKPKTLSLRATEYWITSRSEDNQINLDAMGSKAENVILAPGKDIVIPGKAAEFSIHQIGWKGGNNQFGSPGESPLILSPGKYHVKAPYSLWIQENPNSTTMTGLRAKPGTLELEILKGTGDNSTAFRVNHVKESQIFPVISWGKLVNGLQLGVAIETLPEASKYARAAGKNVVKIGDEMNLLLYIRNASNIPLSFRCAMFPSQDNSPMVTDSDGKGVEFYQILRLQYRSSSYQTIPPGKMLLLSKPHFTLVMKKPDGDDPDPSLIVRPGKYKLSYVECLQDDGSAFFNTTVISGILEFTVTDQ